MEMINQEKLSKLIQSYKSEFNKYIDQELYKWRAVVHFQKYWDIDAPDFKEMLNAALNFKDDNLLVGSMYFPKRMLDKFCEVDVAAVKDMFVTLYNEGLDLAKRINFFIAMSDDLINRYNPEKNHYQDNHAVSTYLWLKFPDKYFIYKSSCVTSLVDKLGCEYKKQNKLKGQNVVNVYAIYNQIAEALNADRELQEMLKSSLTQDCYADPMSRTLAVDFGYYLQTYYKGNNSVESRNPKVWLYAPGEQARMWDECVEMKSIRLGWDDISNLLDFEDKNEIVKALQEVYSKENSSFMNDSLALWQFSREMNVGDVVYVKKGINKIIGRGIVEGNYVYEESLSTYRHTRKVSWTHIGEWECLSERLNIKTLTDITKYPDFVNKLNDLVTGRQNIEQNTALDSRNELYNSFLEKFPIEYLKNMPLEVYTNLNKHDAFCYWLESKLQELGSIWGGTAYKFGIYRYAKKPDDPSIIVADEEYAWYKKYNTQNRDEAYNIVLNTIIKIAEAANEGRFGDIDNITELGDVVKWKIAFLYSNKILIPIYKREMLEEVAMKMGYENPKKAKISELQSFLYTKKGEKDLFEYYDYLLLLIDEMKTTNPNRWWLNANPKFWTLSGWKAGEEQNYTLYNANGNKRRIFQNFIDAKEGDTVICYESTPTKQILCLAEVSKANDGENIWFKKLEALNNPIDFEIIKNVPELQKMEYFVNPNGSFFKLTEEEYQILMENIRENNPLISIDALEKYSDSDFLSEVYITSDELQKLKSLLKNKQNIILQGAPGVGKTFTAERLAYTLMGVKDKSRVEMVQFHQNYSYEDFIMGYKPNEAGGFELKQGVFYKFCKKAANSPEKDFFFIIDEINRGNLSKIFGELLMLIENSYRGKEIKLAYTDELFTVPKNLYIIGMMNTADRSLAMIDYALRRRFSFFEMLPGFESEGFKNYVTKLSSEKLKQVIKQIQTLNEVIRNDESLGQGFCIGHSYFCNQTEFSEEWLNNVIEYDIEPMLKEYWFDEVEKYNTQISILRNLLK